jgi:hypothetical protein
MTDDPIISDDDITRDQPTEGGADKDQGGVHGQDSGDADKDQGAVHGQDSGDAATEDDANLDTGGEEARDVGDE